MTAPPETNEITRLLLDWRAGDDQAFELLVPMVYQELRRLARGQLRKGGHHQTLNTTGLVHEAYMRLVGGVNVDWQDRGHFMAVAARSMRQVVVEYARRSSAAKRGGDERPLTFEDQAIAVSAQADQVLAINEALLALGRRSERLIRVVECRFFAGLSSQETAEALGLNLRTAQRDWIRARAWLQQALRGGPPAPAA